MLFLAPLAILLILCLGFFYWLKYLKLARLIEDVPGSSIRSAAQGYVELAGTGELMPGEPILTPHSKRPCLYYQFYSYATGEFNSTENEISNNLFFINDDTGRCIVDPEGAACIGLVKKKDVHCYRDGTKHVNVEAFIPVGAYLYVLGQFITDEDRSYINIEQQADDLLLSWKSDYKQMLERFDKNEDGELDLIEWEQARQAAMKQVIKENISGHEVPNYPCIRSARHKKKPFIISTIPQEKLVKVYRIKSLISLFGFFVSCILGVMWIYGFLLEMPTLL